MLNLVCLSEATDLDDLQYTDLDLTQQDNIAFLWVWEPPFYFHETVDFNTCTVRVKNAAKQVQYRGIQ